MSEMEIINYEVKKIRKFKRKIFKKADSHTKDILLKYEELESNEREITVKTVYLQAIKNVLDKVKWLLTKSID
ncbi:hypothetical protein [Anaerovorax odorimutans]|uniref:hypothetical protein n=1 Tax=Anaerovorax odorimutans TaxID=109327 RepID=UPI0004142D7D|nr:hypothetical protein [Anaerovorax odorimutans]